MTSGGVFRNLVLSVALLVAATPALRGFEPPAKEYRITGVVVSARDGSPVPYCRISAFALPTAGAVTTGSAQSTSTRADSRQGQPGVTGRIGQGRIGTAAPGRLPGGQIEGPEATADGSGRFTIAVPHPGAWRLLASARGFRAQNYDAHEGFYSAVVLSETTPTYAVTFRLTPDSVLSGLILDDSGEAVASAQVTAELIPPALLGAASRPRIVGSGQTDDRGHYEIGGLAPGQYRLRVQAQPWYSSSSRGNFLLRQNNGSPANTTPSPDPSLDFVYAITWFPGVDDESMAEVLKLGPGEERQADFRLTAIPSVHLKVPRPDALDAPAQGDTRGRPQPQRMVSITRVSGNAGGGMQQMMPAGGSLAELDFGGLSPGTYEVRIPGADGRSSEVRRIEVKAGSPTVLTMETAKPLISIHLEFDGIPNSQPTAIDFIDTETGERISSQPNVRGRGGFQRGDQGGPNPLPEEPESVSRTVMLEPHSYEVYVAGSNAAYLTGIAAEGAKAFGRVVTIAGPASITIHLANKHAQLDGFARIGGEPAAGAMVLLVPATFGTAGALTDIYRAETNTDGSFRIAGITPGPYIIVAIDHGWNVDWQNPGVLGQYLQHGTPIQLLPEVRDHRDLEAVAPN